MWPRGKLVRCLREDMATDSLVEAWVTIYWGLHGHPTGTTPCTPHGWDVNLGHHDQAV